jgi:hypothetical protein
MHDARFDTLARSLAKPGSRRRLLRVLAGSTVSLVAAGLGLRPRPALACDAGFCIKNGDVTGQCHSCSDCTGAGWCIQGNGDICYGDCGAGNCHPANNGQVGCGGSGGNCINNTRPCQQTIGGALTCCPCPEGQQACGDICCDPGVPCTNGQCGTGCGTASARKASGVGVATTTCCSDQQECHGQCIPATDKCCSTDAKSCGQACCGQEEVCCGTGCCPAGTECSFPGDDPLPPTCCPPRQSCGLACKGEPGFTCCRGRNEEGNRFSCASGLTCCGSTCCGPRYTCSRAGKGHRPHCVKKGVHRHPPS